MNTLILKYIDKIISRMVLINYNMGKAYYHYKLSLDERTYKKPPILIYQMGKVGSRSVTDSLKLVINNRQIYHIHILRPLRVYQYESWRKKSFPDLSKGIKYVWICQYLYKKIKRTLSSDGKKLKIITLVRDPIARNISDFFQNIKLKQNGPKGQYIIWGVGREVSQVYDFECSIVDNKPYKLIEIFKKRYPHGQPLEWFDLEFRDVLGVDIYATDFPKSKGYNVYKHKNYEILLIRLENLTDCANEALKNFLNIENFTLVNKNIGYQKDYSSIYQAFKNAIIFNESDLDKMYKSKFVRHFYTESEIDEFRLRWSS